MSTDRISSPSSLIETMRAIARDRVAGTGRGDKSVLVNAPAGAPSETENPRSIRELRKRLHDLAAQVDLADAQSLIDARAPALREILLWEFGSDFRKDPQFLPTVDAIGQALDLNPGFQQRFAKLIADLKTQN